MIPRRALRLAWPWLLVLAIALVTTAIACLALHVHAATLAHELRHVVRLALGRDQATDADDVLWRSPRAIVLAPAALLVGVLAFHLHRRRAAALGFSHVALVGPRGAAPWLGAIPGALRVVATLALVLALARPETFRTVRHEVDTIDIMIVVDMSKSMLETDMRRNRIDAAQRVIRRFLHRTKDDRIGLVVFGQEAMLECPLTQDTKLLEQIVADLRIDDVPSEGTAIGDGLALALAQLRRSDAKSKVVILLSDGDSNSVTRFDPDEAAQAARAMNVKVYTLLVGQESWFGDDSVNPATLRGIAEITGGEFFRAADYRSFDRGFQTVRERLDTTKRTVTERVPDRELFLPLAAIAALLIALERLLVHTRLRRLP